MLSRDQKPPIQFLDESMQLKDQVVFLRLDLNCPVKEGGIPTDTFRIDSSLRTIQFLLERKAKIIIASHLGRPKIPGDKNFSLMEIGAVLAKKLSKEVLFIEKHDPDHVKPLLSGLKDNQLILLENLRFLPGETKNDDELAHEWTSYVTFYVNDAFGSCHRAHASIDALPKVIPQRCAGFLIQNEIRVLDKILNNPERPFTLILGGAKVEDKIPLIENILPAIDRLIIGGGMAYTFLRAKSIPIGKSIVDLQSFSYAKELLERAHYRKIEVILPDDHVVVDSFENVASARVTSTIQASEMAVDIGPESRKKFHEALKGSKTIFWNGPMGCFEREGYHMGTLALLQSLAELKDAYSVVGGGDSASAARSMGFADSLSHISTGGGASLEYLQGKNLPGIEVLRAPNR